MNLNETGVGRALSSRNPCTEKRDSDTKIDRKRDGTGRVFLFAAISTFRDFSLPPSSFSRARDLLAVVGGLAGKPVRLR